MYKHKQPKHVHKCSIKDKEAQIEPLSLILSDTLMYFWSFLSCLAALACLNWINFLSKIGHTYADFTLTEVVWILLIKSPTEQKQVIMLLTM